MYKKTIFLWIIFAVQTSFVAEQNIDLSIERNIQPLHPLFHQQITAEQIRRGHTINTPGSYYVSSPFVKLVGGDSPSTTVSVNNPSDTTNGIIAITSSNVTLNLNGSMFLTDQGNKVVVVIAKDLDNVTVKNGIIGKGSSTFDSGVIIGQNSTNVTLEDLTISGCSGAGGSNGAISFKGATNNTIKGTKLKNLNLSHNTTGAVKIIYCDNFTAENINANNNTISGGGSPIITIENSNGISINNSTITKNSSSSDIYAIKATSGSHFLHFNNLKITNNESSSSGGSSIVAGIYCDAQGGGDDLEEINIVNCTISRNRGTNNAESGQQAYGIYLNKVNLARIDNCMVIDNAAKANANSAGHSAGLKLLECDFCTVKNSSFIGNKSGKYINGTPNTADATNELNINDSMNVGAGIINMGSGQGGTQLNKSNQFINCVCNNNGTQVIQPTPSTNYVDDYTNARYSNKDALEVGVINQWAQNTTFIDCTFNNNGITQHSDGLSWFVMGIGALNVTSAKKTHFIRCTANNNNYFGFCDSGVLQGSQQNSQSYFTSCLAITNGTQNEIAKTHVTLGLNRNCRVYFSATVATETPPFLDLTFKTHLADLSNSSPHANVSVREV